MRHTHLRPSASICGPLLLVAIAAGCQTTNNGPSAERKSQEAALKDPWSYGPDNSMMNKPKGPYDDVDPTDISGGGTSELNKRAMQRDLDTVFGK